MPPSIASPFRRPLLARALDALLPPLCFACAAPTAAHQTLCPDCWRRVTFIAPPFCAICGAPFEIPVGADTLCGQCIAAPPRYAKARAAVLYDETSRGLILAFKHGDRTYPAPALAAWMKRAGGDLWDEADFIIPVPLHRWRLFKRRYNQAALLARELGDLTGKPVLVDALLRKRATAQQGHLSRKQRLKNVAGAFGLNEASRAHLKDKTVMLVDDVLTTGATVNECARILMKGGAKAVYVLTLARTRGMA